MRADPARPLLTIREAAAVLGVSEATARRLARSGDLPGLVSVPGHRLLVRARVLDAWLAGELDTRDPAPVGAA